MKQQPLLRVMAMLCALMLWVPAVLAEDSTEAPTQTPALERSPEPTPTPYFAPNAIPTATPVTTAAPVEGDTFLTHAVEIAHRISLLASNPMFMSSYTFEPVDPSILEKLQAGDHTLPERIFHLSGETLIHALYGDAAEETARLDFTRPELRRDLVDSLPEMLWGRREYFELSVLHHLARYKTFAAPQAEGCGLFVFLYAEGTPIVLTWYTQEGAASISAVFMPDEVLEACTAAEDVSAWFAGKGLPDVPFEEVLR